jgi:uncharacterized membrane protein YhhN
MEKIMYIWIPLCFFYAAVFIITDRREHHTAAAVLKGIASACFVMPGIFSSDGSYTSFLIVSGLILGAAADVVLHMRYVDPKRKKFWFMAGIFLFLSGHIAYIAAVFPYCSQPVICILCALFCTVLLQTWLNRHTEASRTFRIAGTFYVGTFVTLNCIAVGNLIASPSAFSAMFASGAFLFLISDIMLIINTFGTRKSFLRRCVYLYLYYSGQLLIAFSMLHQFARTG